MIKGRFIEPTEENVKKYRDEHFSVSFEIQKSFYKELHEATGAKTPNDEDIKAFVNKTLDPEYMKSHDVVVPGTQNDYYDYIEEIKECPTEKLIIVLLNENKEPIGSKVVETGTGCSVNESDGPMHNLLRYLLSDKRAKYFIDVHNHPNSIGLFTSTGDEIQTSKMLLLGNMIEIELLDSCIINEFGFYSACQEAKERGEKSAFEYKMNPDLKRSLIKENLTMYMAIRQALEGKR